MTEERKSYTFTIEFDDGRPPKTATVVQGKVKLKFVKLLNKAQKSGDWDDVIPAFAAMLRITPEEAEEIALDDFMAMAEVMQQGMTVPNASAPPTE